jgi:diaminohydroxyphosphoribosylaminopyrimidine deaminase/5-amino-6-(5-phosphoribosylamino)uracil reductase
MGGRDLTGVLAELKGNDLQSVLVEGGAEIAGAFIDAKLVDKVTFMYSPIVIGGRTAPDAIAGSGADDVDSAISVRDVTVTRHGDDIEITGYPNF